MQLSVIIPLYNEQDSLKELLDRLEIVIEKLGINKWEVWFIDDGSEDRTCDVVLELVKNNRRVRSVRFRKNLGKTWALKEGFKRASGKLIATMDGDLQDEPENLPAMIEKLEKYDLVVGWKKERHDPWHKVWPSRIFNLLVRWATGLNIHDFNCGLKIMKRKVADELNLYGELHRFIPLLAYGRGFRVGECVVTHRARKHGKSKYGWGRMVVGLYDLMTQLFLIRFGQRPGQYFGMLGTVFTFLGVAVGMYLSFLWMGGTRIGQRPLLNLAVLLVVIGVQMISFGFLAEMIVNMKMSSDELPIEDE